MRAPMVQVVFWFCEASYEHARCTSTGSGVRILQANLHLFISACGFNEC